MRHFIAEEERGAVLTFSNGLGVRDGHIRCSGFVHEILERALIRSRSEIDFKSTRLVESFLLL
jgi:hypothetical protein